MNALWSLGPSTAEAAREALAPARPLNDSTVRTILRRLEEKGYIHHRLERRTYVYEVAEARENVAAKAVRQIIDRFCGGSVEQLLAGMVDNEVLKPAELERLATKIAWTRRG